MPENKTSVSPSSVSLDLGRRVSMGEIAAFIAETKRLLNGGSASVADRLGFFEWKADLFGRLGEHESARTAAAEAARLREQLGLSDGRGVA